MRLDRCAMTKATFRTRVRLADYGVTLARDAGKYAKSTRTDGRVRKVIYGYVLRTLTEECERYILHGPCGPYPATFWIRRKDYEGLGRLFA